MRKRSLYRTFYSALLILLLFVNSIAQLQLGSQGLTNAIAPTINTTTRITRGAARGIPLRFLSRIGGVAFDGAAMPAGDMKVSNLQINYMPQNEDGKRLSVKLNATQVSAPVYDWQLIPIAKFADTTNSTCFTLFGELADKAQEMEVRRRGGSVLNYHPKFTNTLLGLRLFQLDNLIINPNAVYLPSENGRIILGSGEVSPDIKANAKAFKAFNDFIVAKKDLYDFRSYLISNRNSQVYFSAQDGRLNLTGDPTYYFWTVDTTELDRLKDKDTRKEVLTNALEKLLARLDAASKKQPNLTLRSFLEDEVLLQLQTFEKEVNLPDHLSDDLFTLSMTEKPKRRQALAPLSEESLMINFAFLQTLNSLTAKENEVLGKEVSDRLDLVRSINPAVWDAGANVMRYAAFFRYYKQNYPLKWKQFLTQIKNVKLQPSVKTPNVLEPEPEE